MIGRLDAEDIQAINEPAAGMIPGARLRWLDGVAHVPHLEADPTTLNEIAAFVDQLTLGETPRTCGGDRVPRRPRRGLPLLKSTAYEAVAAISLALGRRTGSHGEGSL